MEIDFKAGHIVLKNGKGPVYVVLHSGPRIVDTINRDTGADCVSYLTWRKTGGTLVLVTVPRHQEVGIDFNRDFVDAKKALKNWESVQTEGAGRYKNRYAWAAYDMKDHRTKESMYRNFWSKVSRMGDTFFLIHSTSLRVGHIPTLVDIITFDGKGLSMKTTKNIVRKLNTKYEQLFLSVKILYDKSVHLKHEIGLENIFSKAKSFVLEEFIERDKKKIKKYAEPSIVQKLEKNFTPENFMTGIESALRRSPAPRLTIENVFSGKKAFGPKKYLVGKAKAVVEVEFNEFLNIHFPKISAEILQDFVKEVSSATASRPKKE